MSKRGLIEIRDFPSSALQMAVDWLRSDPSDNERIALANLLEKRLRSKWRRSSSPLLRLPRVLASSLCVKVDALVVWSALTKALTLAFVPSGLLELAHRCRLALRARRGRPPLSREQCRHEIRIRSVRGAFQDRFRARLKRRERVDAWIDKHLAAGLTLLTMPNLPTGRAGASARKHGPSDTLTCHWKGGFSKSPAFRSLLRNS